ncbi:MAG TPA: phage tail sheath subtilisin-like domain-containing protein, partial [Solirubrobacteraceae bacterium]|nr:phage tail sheath subtilisin-like domain-containing protein [Solirubrobacteraceae bacterium]
MPEYLAPAVYVEEVDTGSKPIEGVSTSTTGMVGVTERGPVNVPMLVTGVGEYRRIFGDALNPALYFNPNPPGDHTMHFLPHGVEGFFTNGGKRLFVTRILNPGVATPASRTLVAPDTATPLTGHLLRGAAPGDTTVLLAENPGFAATDTVQVGDLAEVEFRGVTGTPAVNYVGVNFGFSRGHASPEVIQVITLTGDGVPRQLATAVSRGGNSLTLDNAAAIVNGDVLRIGTAGGPDEEFAIASGAAVGNSVPLRGRLLFDHAATVAVQRNTVATTANKRPVAAGSGPMPGDPGVITQTGAGVFNAGDIVGISTATATNFDATQADAEVRRVSRPTRLALEQGAYADYPSGSRVERLTLNAAIPAFNLDDDADTGTTVVNVSDRSSLAAGQLLEIGLGTDRELVEIGQLLPPTLPGLNPGRVQLLAGLRRAHGPASGVVSRRQITGVTHATSVAVAAAAGDTSLTTAGAANLANGDFIRVVAPSGSRFYHALASASAVTALTPVALALDAPLAGAKSAGAGVYERVPMLEVRAIDAGQWGNRLRVGMEMQRDALLTTAVRATPAGGTLRLNSAAGVETGTELEITDGVNTVRVKVASIDLQNDALITLEASTPLLGWVAAGAAVRSIEYRMEIELARQPDPANPSRNNQAIDREVFANLSLDPRHSSYFQRVIGCTWALANPAATLDDMGRPLRREDRRSEGASAYVRVLDLAPVNGLRAGPVASYEQRPGSTPRLILLPLANGNDQLGSVDDTTYIGTDDPNPELRTGLYTLRNVEEISIVAAPGRTSVATQAALINHCELMRYRFAVLDGNPPPDDAMANIQAQRQQFDTKYAALYHPWLLIPDPYPVTTGAAPDYAIPPSGHMLGIYARTDIERGVHKAPANEVVRGVTGLQRLLNKEQQDIL